MEFISFLCTFYTENIKIFKEQLKTDKEANKFIKKITFSIDIQSLSFRKFTSQFLF